MDKKRARIDAEALRYRLEVRLHLIARAAQVQGRPEVFRAAKALRSHVRSVTISENSGTSPMPARSAPADADRVLAKFRPQVLALQAQVDMADDGLPIFPRWARVSLLAAPVATLISLTLFVLRRRRRFGAQVHASQERSKTALDRAPTKKPGTTP